MGVEISRFIKPRVRSYQRSTRSESPSSMILSSASSREESRKDQYSKSSTKSLKSESRNPKEARNAFKKTPKTSQTTIPPPGRGFKKKNADETHWVFGGESAIPKTDGMSDLYWDLMNGDFNAPVHEKLYSGDAKVLDVGCKEGIWIIQMARTFPSTTFIGIDSHPPTDLSHFDQSLKLEALPFNVSFESGDPAAMLPFEDNTFDYVVARQMASAIKGGSNGWKNFFDELTRIVKDGGYVEVMDTDWIPFDAGPYFTKLCAESRALSMEAGIDIEQSSNISRFLENTFRLTDVRHDYVSCPIGWSGHLGTKFANNVSNFITLVEAPMRARLNLTKEPFGNEYEMFKQATLEECKLRETFFNFYYGYGRKCISQ